MYYRYILLCICVFIIGCRTNLPEVPDQDNTPETEQVHPNQIIEHFDFDNESDLQSWSTRSWNPNGVSFLWEKSGGINNTPCISIENRTGYPNDSYFFR